MRMLIVIFVLGLMWINYPQTAEALTVAPSLHFSKQLLNIKAMQYKKCLKCKGVKPLNEFSKHNGFKSGIDCKCKSCKNLYSKEHRRTKHGLITKIYSGQLTGTKKRGHELPTYSRQELEQWLMNQPLFHKLFDAWVASGYDRWLIPSCDRLDDYKPYTFENIKLTIWQKNFRKGHDFRLNGFNNKMSTSIIGISKSTKKEICFYSIGQASRELNIDPSSIAKCCRNKCKSAGGYYWEINYTGMDITQ